MKFGIDSFDYFRLILTHSLSNSLINFTLHYIAFMSPFQWHLLFFGLNFSTILPSQHQIDAINLTTALYYI